MCPESGTNKMELLPFSDSSDRFKHELVQGKVYDFWTANEGIMPIWIFQKP